MPDKFREKYRKNQRTGTFQKSPSGPREEPGVAQAATWCDHPLGRARGPWSTSGCPLRLFIPRDDQTSGTEPFFAISPLFRHRRASKIGSASSPLPGILPEGGLTSGSFPSTMDASRMIRE